MGVETLGEEWMRHHFDHFSPEFTASFHEVLGRMRTACPVTRSDAHGGFWVVTAYEEVLRVAQDWETFSSAFGLTVPESPAHIRNYPVEVDPPLQRDYKRLTNRYLTPAAIKPWESRTRALVDELLGTCLEQVHCEFMDSFARPLPALSFFELALNAPPDQLRHVARVASRSVLPTAPDAAECWVALSRWIEDFLDRRRREPPRHDVVDATLAAVIDGRPITPEEVIGTIQLLILGGLHTTAGALGHIMIRLARQPDLAERLRDRPEMIPAAVEEFLRLDSPFVQIVRTTTRDVTVRDAFIRAGEKVVIHWGSANRDPAVFDDADRVLVGRPRNPHLAFGAGPHRCAGSSLARMNLRVALEEILARTSDIQLQPGARISYQPAVNRVPDSVPLTLIRA